MRMKRSLIAAIAAVIAMPQAVAPTMADDRALFYRGAKAAGRAPLVAGGKAVIDEALARIIPAPYRVTLDDSVPPSLYLVWGSGDNWMEVLKRALAPIGLVAKPDWSQNRVVVSWPKQPPAPVVAAPARVVTPSPEPAPRAPKKRGFEIVQPAPDPAPAILAPTPAESITPQPTSVETTSINSPAGRLPAAKDMWLLMQAAVAGKHLVLTGQSGVLAEKKRVQFANTYAKKLRGRLLAVGFPPASVIVVERDRHTERSKPGIKILIETGEV